MKLTYRGISYESSNQAATAPATDLRYRGASYRLNQVARAENLNAILVYRGNAYTVQPAAATAPNLPTVKSASSVEAQARALTMNHHRVAKNRQQSMLQRSASEVGLTANLANYWNHIQGKLHPSFAVSYDRSHASLS